MNAKELFNAIKTSYGSGIFGNGEEIDAYIGTEGVFPILAVIPIPEAEEVSFVADRFNVFDTMDVYCLQNATELDVLTSAVFDPAKAGEVKLLKSLYPYMKDITILESLTAFQKFNDGVISSGYRIKIKNSPFCP